MKGGEGRGLGFLVLPTPGLRSSLLRGHCFPPTPPRPWLHGFWCGTTPDLFLVWPLELTGGKFPGI